MTYTDLVKRLEQAVKKHESLSREYSDLMVKYQAAATQYAQLAEEAKKLYGTDDINELREIYKRLEKENEEAVERFEKELGEFEKAISTAKEKLQELENAI